MSKDAYFTMPNASENRPDQIQPMSEEVRKLSNRKIFSDANYPYKYKMDRNEYEPLKQDLQIELLIMQNWVKETGQHIVILFEKAGLPPAKVEQSSA